MGLLENLLDAIYDNGTIMSMNELCELAYGVYGSTEFVEDANGNIVDSRKVYTREGLQEIADIYAPDFNCINF